ncbi:MAG TPA: hypothetical protein VG324_15795, partial [Blastocatellia bacterium]|nr:hypothetical protein [Blastocatellia bacterium]
MSINISNYLHDTGSDYGLNDTPGANASAAITAPPGLLHNMSLWRRERMIDRRHQHSDNNNFLETPMKLS